MSNLVNIKNNNVYISTKILAQKLNRQHKVIYNLVNNYKKELELVGGVLHFESAKPKKGSKGGTPTKLYYLNEEQFLFLIMNMRTKSNELNTVMKIKIEISKQFVSMKKWILEQKTQKANQEYLEIRKQSKLGLETDIIKQFVEYATKQGSKSANKYYMNISKMENKAFFILKEKFNNVREILNITQLSKIMYADIVVRQALIEGMEKQMFYKDIYQLAKNKVIQASETLPKEIIPGIKFKQIGRGFLND